ncbi:PQQ-binding-like beta-propeller repeat protein [candidate division KSB1 bacterium]
MKKCTPVFILFFLVQIYACSDVSEGPSLLDGDWSQYRSDAGRCGYTPQDLPENLSLRWKYEQKSPSAAWKGVHTRMTFDYAYEPVVAGDILYFGSSTDCMVYALDVGTGGELWSFFTDSPVRFAPAVWKDRIFFVSDDGYLYCLSSDKGELLWKKCGGADNSMVLGNDRMVSRLPARGGVVIKDDVVYFGAGIWPSEGIYIYALDPETGEEIWINGDSGGLEWDQPHGGARAKSGISSQGYLAAAGDHLFVPTGRAVPCALNLKNGELDYFHLQKFRSLGGSRVLATDSYLFVTSGNTRDLKEIIGRRNAVCSNKDGERLTSDELNSQAIVVSPDYIFYVDSKDGGLKAIDRRNLLIEKEEISRKGNRIKQKYLNSPLWSIKTNQPESISLIAAGNKIISGSVNNKVTVMDAGTKSVVQIFEVDGIPYGLAVSGGRLFISTDNGSIYCFDAERTQTARVIRKGPVNFPYGSNEIYAEAAEEIVKQSGITRGYCLDLGCGDGRLAFELAKKTNLFIYAIDPDSKNVEIARERLFAAGLYGSSVIVHQGDINNTPYPEYFANLIVSCRSVTEGTDIFKSSEISRIQKPYGGVVCIGKPGMMKKSMRGALDGAGDWTHQYSDPANTISSEDELVKGRLGILWFRDSDFEMPSRHGRGVAPLFSGGRLFVQGNHGIRAVDAYNGHTLWEYYIDDIMKPYDQDHLNGAAITQGNWCIEGDRLYVRLGASTANHTGRSCLILDAATGTKIAEYRMPQESKGNIARYWGYIAIDNGTIYGTTVNYEHITKWGYRESDMNKLFSESNALFAMDAATGNVKWMYKAEHSIRHNSIAIGNGRVYLIDRPIAEFDKLRNPHSEGEHPGGKIVALNAKSGKVIYEIKDNIYGTLLALSIEHDILIMTYQFTRFRLPSEVGGKMAAFRASDGERLWDIQTGIDASQDYSYSSRPIINGRIIYFEPKAFDIMTGEQLDFTMSRSYACGITAGSKNMLVFRSATIGYINLNEPEKGTQNYGGIRPGCWINALPAGGIVIMPEATARCDCSYLIKASIALVGH